MNQLEIYTDFVAPVVKAIRQHNNEFFRLDYYEISPKDITVDHDNKLWDFMSENNVEKTKEQEAAYCDDETTPYIGDALDWVSSKMGLTYLHLDKGMSDLEMVLG